MSDTDYKAAYERQKAAREKAEQLLENKSRELFDLNKNLQHAYKQIQNQQKQLIHQEKMVSLGVLSAGIAHEINNPVGFITSNLQTLSEYINRIDGALEHHKNLRVAYRHKTANNPDLLKFINELEILALNKDVVYIVKDSEKLILESLDGTNRIADIVKQLRNFSHSGGQGRSYIDVNDCINNTLKLLVNETKYKSTIVTELSELPLLYANSGELSQVILNLIMNANQAMESPGNIQIRTLHEDSDIIIEVTDDGPGISPEVIENIFDPFFTTKGAGKGTGLGLSIVNTIIEGFGGKIFVESEPNEGTVFTIRLPVD